MCVATNKNQKVDVRLIAATNKDLAVRVREGSFREDLFYRLNVIHISIPPLRERKEDLRDLADRFIGESASKLGKQVRGITKEALRTLETYDWPGNVRELRNEIERAVILCDGPRIEAREFSLPISAISEGPTGEGPTHLEELERAHILKTLEQTGGNQTRAAERLGINRKTLYLKLKKYGIKEPDGP